MTGPPAEEWPLSLASGAAGIALMHLARGSPDVVSHRWLQEATATGLQDATGRSGLFHGLPAVAYLLVHAPHQHYRSARATVLDQMRMLVRARLQMAHARIDRGDPASFGEYDLVSGLTGVAVALWHCSPSDPLLEHILIYLVRLTHPIQLRGQEFPGWWVHHPPDTGATAAEFPLGHANLGMAHGAAGVLALLALTYRFGVQVSGHAEAISRICATLDCWRCQDHSRTWWPPWISTPIPEPTPHPGAPTWCYGTAGLARAQQLAGLALHDPGRQRLAESAMYTCLDDQEQTSLLTTPGLCHGTAGIAQTLERMMQDQSSRPDGFDLRRHQTFLRKRLTAGSPAVSTPGLLNGAAGIALVAETPTLSRALLWDRFLLLI